MIVVRSNPVRAVNAVTIERTVRRPLIVKSATKQGPAGPPGERGPEGSPGPSVASFTFVQATPTSVWTIDHNLGFFPSVSVTVEESGVRTLIGGEVTHASPTRTTLSFSKPTAGTARLN